MEKEEYLKEWEMLGKKAHFPIGEVSYRQKLLFNLLLEIKDLLEDKTLKQKERKN